jgi:hypothetical protein
MKPMKKKKGKNMTKKEKSYPDSGLVKSSAESASGDDI